MRFRRRPKVAPPPPSSDLSVRLRSAERRLKGWTVYGDGLNLTALLCEAADAIDALADRTEEGDA